MRDESGMFPSLKVACTSASRSCLPAALRVFTPQLNLIGTERRENSTRWSSTMLTVCSRLKHLCSKPCLGLYARAGGRAGRMLVSIVPPLRSGSRAWHQRMLPARCGVCPLGTPAPGPGRRLSALLLLLAPSPRCLLNLNKNVSQVSKPCFDTGVTWRMLSAVPSRPDASRCRPVPFTSGTRTCSDLTPTGDGCLPEEDTGKRLGEILFIIIILEELYLTVTLAAVLSPSWECGTFSPPTRRAGCLYRQTACGATRAANGNELAVIAEVAALITVYLTTVLSQLTSSWGRWEGDLVLFKP